MRHCKKRALENRSEAGGRGREATNGDVVLASWPGGSRDGTGTGTVTQAPTR